MRGWRVLIRPSIISGNSVISETSRTSSPMSRSACAVPPVETSSTPAPASRRAKSTTPRLSETEINARRTGLSALMESPNVSAAAVL